MKLDPYLSPYTELSSKWNKDLNIRPRTSKGEVESGHQLSGTGRDTPNKAPIVQEGRPTISKWDVKK